jgi:hypothetical protein
MALAADSAGKRKLEGHKAELSAEISIIQKINDLLLDRKQAATKSQESPQENSLCRCNRRVSTA